MPINDTLKIWISSVQLKPDVAESDNLSSHNSKTVMWF